jgi:hypothetical protein
VGGGGAIYVERCELHVEISNFTNTTSFSYGGALLPVEGIRHNITGCKFTHNRAKYVSGAVGMVYWNDASDREHHILRNRFELCDGGGVGAGGVSVLYFGSQHERNMHQVGECQFVNCTGGNGQVYSGGGGGGGAGGCSILYLGAVYKKTLSSIIFPAKVSSRSRSHWQQVAGLSLVLRPVA